MRKSRIMFFLFAICSILVLGCDMPWDSSGSSTPQESANDCADTTMSFNSTIIDTSCCSVSKN